LDVIIDHNSIHTKVEEFIIMPQQSTTTLKKSKTCHNLQGVNKVDFSPVVTGKQPKEVVTMSGLSRLLFSPVTTPKVPGDKPKEIDTLPLNVPTDPRKIKTSPLTVSKDQSKKIPLLKSNALPKKDGEKIIIPKERDTEQKIVNELNKNKDKSVIAILADSQADEGIAEKLNGCINNETQRNIEAYYFCCRLQYGSANKSGKNEWSDPYNYNYVLIMEEKSCKVYQVTKTLLKTEFFNFNRRYDITSHLNQSIPNMATYKDRGYEWRIVPDNYELIQLATGGRVSPINIPGTREKKFYRIEECNDLSKEIKKEYAKKQVDKLIENLSMLILNNFKTPQDITLNSIPNHKEMLLKSVIPARAVILSKLLQYSCIEKLKNNQDLLRGKFIAWPLKNICLSDSEKKGKLKMLEEKHKLKMLEEKHKKCIETIEASNFIVDQRFIEKVMSETIAKTSDKSRFNMTLFLKNCFNSIDNKLDEKEEEELFKFDAPS
jgi:hypothetical protein